MIKDFGHIIFDDCLTHEICRKCKCEGSELFSVKCGDESGLAKFRKDREVAFERQLYEAEIGLALDGVKQLTNKHKAPRLKKMMMDRYKWATGKDW